MSEHSKQTNQGERLARSSLRGFSGALVRRLRHRRGLTIEDLADLAEVSPQALGKWERAAALPSPPALRRLADALHISVVDLAPVPVDETVIADLRTQAGHTQAMTAAAVDRPKSSIALIERGRTAYDKDLAARMAEAWGIDEELVRTAWQRAIQRRRDRVRNMRG